MIKINKIYQGDALSVLKTFPDEFVSCVVTSPPYWALRDYEVAGQLGLEDNPDLYIKELIAIFGEVKRVLRKDGTCWVNLGDTYYTVSGGKFLNDNISNTEKVKKMGLDRVNKLRDGNFLPSKCLCMLPERFVLAMVGHRWILRNKIIWFKPNHMPTSVKDRFCNSWEYIYFFSKSKKYWFDLDSVREPHKDISIKRTKNSWNGHREKGSSYEGMNIKKCVIR